jgi:hypothetical protein
VDSRLWSLAEFPEAADLPEPEAVTQAAEHALRALGVARARDVERHFTIGRYPGLDLERAAWARPVSVEGGAEPWWVHRDVLGLLDEDWRPRTTLLSPFDNLICDRDRAERLWASPTATRYTSPSTSAGTAPTCRRDQWPPRSGRWRRSPARIRSCTPARRPSAYPEHG